MVRYCAICTDDVTDETRTMYENYFCTKECELRYHEMSWPEKTLVGKYREIFEKVGIWITYDRMWAIQSGEEQSVDAY